MNDKYRVLFLKVGECDDCPYMRFIEPLGCRAEFRCVSKDIKSGYRRLAFCTYEDNQKIKIPNWCSLVIRRHCDTKS